jgi:lon-related putative ATP-dependent protease
MTDFSEFKVPLKDLRLDIDPSKLHFDSFDDIEPGSRTIGQKRATEAIRVGAEIKSPGYNIFVTGLVGTGKKSTIKKILDEIKPNCVNLSDFCYVNNFSDPDQPCLIRLPKGKGKEFKKDMADHVNHIKNKLVKLFEEDKYYEDQNNISKKYADLEKDLFFIFEKKITADGFAIVQVQSGPYTRPDIFPMVEGKPIPIEKMEHDIETGKLQFQNFDEFKSKFEKYKEEFVHVLKESRNLAKAMNKELKELERGYASSVINGEIEDLVEKYTDEKIKKYLSNVKERIFETLDNFKKEDQSDKSSEKSIISNITGVGQGGDPERSNDFEVNIILDNSENNTCPVIVETSPTFVNLFGTIEQRYEHPGVWRTDFMKIKSGSLLKANGGYLILTAMDVFTEPGVWVTLKRCLKYNKLEIAPADSIYRLNSTALKPEPIDIDLKVIMIGDFRLYDMLYEYEEDMRKIFKIRADFDSEMDLDDSNIKEYMKIICKVCKDEKLLPLKVEAISRIIEEGIRMASRKGKITTKFGEIADLIRESHYFALKANSAEVAQVHVENALDAKKERNNMMESRIQEYITRGTILISTEDRRVGQINGLAVYSIGNYMFGKPSRITASTSTGKAGIVNIEREAKLSGKTHDKGVLIITGFLRERYAQDKAMNLSASICFEQSYSGIDGDSASSTEIYCLLSSLSGVGIKQNIAVTGSVNQKGDVQPIGGVNEKIEGFFDVCKARGLTGEHGVMIPKQNVADLMLKEEIVQAVKDGKFTIYAVEKIDQGIEILTDVKAGEKDSKGLYPKGTINFLVEKKLKEISSALEESDKDKNDKPKKKKAAKSKKSK